MRPHLQLNPAGRGRNTRRGGHAAVLFLVLAAAVSPAARGAADEARAEPTARQLFNDGTQKLLTNKLADAEALLQAAVAGQEPRVQVAALYNLGEVRFLQGEEQLKKGPSPAIGAARAELAGDAVGAFTQAADKALAGTELLAIVEAYSNGRGTRKELKAAIEAVKQAMDSYGAVLTKWQRASGDFKSAFELNPADADARTNAAAVDRRIALLVDQQQMMMAAMQAMQKQLDEMREKMRQLKGRVPDDGSELKGGSGDDEEDDDGKGRKPEPKPDQKEGPSRDGKPTQPLSLEEAGRLLNMLRLDGNRNLPIGAGDTAPPRRPNQRDW